MRRAYIKLELHEAPNGSWSLDKREPLWMNNPPPLGVHYDLDEGGVAWVWVPQGHSEAAAERKLYRRVERELVRRCAVTQRALDRFQGVMKRKGMYQ